MSHEVLPLAEAVSEDGTGMIEQKGDVLFSSLGLNPLLLKAIADLGFIQATPIQGLSLPVTLLGRDVTGQAQTGTGKTAAFLITIFEHLLKYPIPLEERYASEPRALVVAPTRELALQIEKDAVALARYCDFGIISVVGGMDYGRQQQRLEKEVIDLLIATPGRLLDFCRKETVFLDQVEVLVLDEADRMLDMGFLPDMRQIIRRTPPPGERQTLLFSATFDDLVMELAERWTSNPEKLAVESETVTTDQIDQRVLMVSSHQKQWLLINLVKRLPNPKVIVFANRRDEVRRVNEVLKRWGINAAMLSGEISQTQRLKTLEKFRQGTITVLVATDVAGRGIHIDGVTHVINYNIPEDPEDYVHRIGRTGRAGLEGVAIALACENESFQLPEIEAYIGARLTCEIPDA